jgi:hypothetical protein
MHHLRKFGQRTLSITVSSMPPWMPVLPIRVPEHIAHGMCRLGRSFRVLQDGVTIAGVAVVPDLATCQTTELLNRNTPWLRSCSASGALHSSHTRVSRVNTHGSQQQMAPHRQCVVEPVPTADDMCRPVFQRCRALSAVVLLQLVAAQLQGHPVSALGGGSVRPPARGDDHDSSVGT